MAQSQQSFLDNAVGFVKNSLGNLGAGVSRVVASAPSVVSSFANDYNNFNNQLRFNQQKQNTNVLDLTKNLVNTVSPVVKNISNAYEDYQKTPIGQTGFLSFKTPNIGDAVNMVQPYMPKELQVGMQNLRASKPITSAILLDQADPVKNLKNFNLQDMSTVARAVFPGLNLPRELLPNKKVGEYLPNIQNPTEGARNELIKQGMQEIKKGQDIEATLPKIEDRGPIGNVTNPEFLKRAFLTNAPSFITSLGVGALTAIATKSPAATFVATYATAFPQNASEFFVDAKQHGLDENQAINLAKIGGGITSVLDAFGADAILERLTVGPVVKETIKKALIKDIFTGMIKGFVGEGSTESMQQIIQNAIAKIEYEPARNLLSGALENFVVGGAMGGGAGTVVNTAANLTTPGGIVNVDTNTDFGETPDITPNADFGAPTDAELNLENDIVPPQFQDAEDIVKQSQQAPNLSINTQPSLNINNIDTSQVPAGAHITEDGLHYIDPQTNEPVEIPKLPASEEFKTKEIQSAPINPEEEANKLLKADIQQALNKSTNELTDVEGQNTTPSLPEAIAATKEQATGAIGGLLSDEEINFLGVGAVDSEGKFEKSKSFESISQVIDAGQAPSGKIFDAAFNEFADKIADPGLYGAALKEIKAGNKLTNAQAKTRIAQLFGDFLQGQPLGQATTSLFNEVQGKYHDLTNRLNSAQMIYDQILQGTGALSDVSNQAYINTVKNGGITIDLAGGQPAEGFAYSPFKGVETIVDKNDFTPNDISSFVDKNFELLSQPGNHVGMWEQDGKIYMDVSQVGQPTAETLQAAQDAQQLAVFDLKTFQEVPLGKIDKGVYNKLYEATNHPYLNGGQNEGADSLGSNPSVSEVPTSEETGQQTTPGPGQPEGLKTDIGTIPTEELITRSKSNSKFKEAYQQELDRRGVNPADETQKERGHVETVRQNDNFRQNVREGVKGTYDVTTDEGRMQFGREYITNNPTEAEQRVLSDEPLSNELFGIAYALQEKYQEDADALEAKGNTIEANALDDRVIALENKVAEKLTPAAQVLQFAHLYSEKSPTAMVRWAQKIYDEANKWNNISPAGLYRKVTGKESKFVLTEEKKAYIMQEQKKIRKIKDPQKKMAATQALMREVGKDIPPSIMDLMEAYRYQNMLINPLTQFRNIYGNTLNSVFLRPATLASESFLDLAAAPFGRERKVGLLESPKYIANLIKGVGPAKQAFIEGLRGIESDPTKYQDSVQFSPYSRVTTENLPKYLTVAGRMLEGADKFFTELIGNSELQRLVDKGIKPTDAKKQAFDTAAYFLYRSKLDPGNITGQGHVLSLLDNATEQVINLRKSKVARYTGLNWFVPFVRVPMAVAKMSIEYNPITGAITLPGNSSKSTQIAKMQIGAMAMFMGAALAAQGKTDWSPPDDDEAKKLWYAAGHRPFSFHIDVPGLGERAVPFQYLGPLGLSMAIPAAVKHFEDQSRTALTDSQEKKIFNEAMGVLNYFGQTTPLSGLGGFIRTAQGDVDYSVVNNIAFTMGQTIPLNGLLSFIANIVDPVYRKPQSGSFVQQWQKGIPFVSKGLESYKEPSGNDATRTFSGQFLPYTLGVPKEGYTQPFDSRMKELQNNAVVNKLTKEGSTGGVNLDAVQGREAKTKEEVAKLKTDTNKLLKTYFETDSPQLKKDIEATLGKWGIDFGKASEDYLTQDTKVEPQGLGRVAQEKLKRSNEFSYVRKLRDNYLSTDSDFVDKEFQRVSITPADLEYDDKTALADDVQVDEIKSMIDGLQGDDLTAKLVEMRRVSEGTRKALLTDTLINTLNKDGVISDDLAASLKRVQWDAASKSFKLAAGTGSGKKPNLSMSGVKTPDVKFVTPKFSGPPASGSDNSSIKYKNVDTTVPTALSRRVGSSYKPQAIQPRLKSKVVTLGGLGSL